MKTNQGTIMKIKLKIYSDTDLIFFFTKRKSFFL